MGVTTDGTVVWTAVQPLRLIATVAGVINQHSFVASPLVMGGPSYGKTAVITVRNNVSHGTALEITDGTSPPLSFIWNFDTAGATVAANIVSQINLGTTQIRVSSVSGSTNIGLTNGAATQANITLTGDIALPPAFLITNFSPGYLDGGAITWLSGNNAGTTSEIKAYSGEAGSIVTTWLGMAYAPQIGDRFYYYPGCDKRRETCFLKFANMLNFRGEPDIPGVDQMLAYPYQ